LLIEYIFSPLPFDPRQAVVAALVLPSMSMACHRPDRVVFLQLYALAFTAHDMDQAIKVVESALQEYPDDPELLENYGTTLRFAHRPREAHRVLTQLHALPTASAKSAKSYGMLAQALLLDGHVTNATHVAEEGLVAYTEDTTLLTVAGEAHRASGNCPGAIKARRKVIAVTPEASLHQDMFVELAHPLMACGELAAAKELSTQILKHPVRSQKAELAAWAHANLAHNAWLVGEDAATGEAFEHARKAMDLQQHWQQWPFYCAVWNAEASSAGVGKADSHYNNAWREEQSQLAATKGSLARVIKQLREHECSSGFILSQLKTFFSKPKPAVKEEAVVLVAAGAPSSNPPFRYSPSNYQYGTFFFTGFRALMESAVVQPHVARAKEHGLRFVVLGSNVGNEAIYGALGYGLDTTGYEIICGLVEAGKKALKDNEIAPAQATINLVCADALRSDLTDTGIVYIDNEAWDEFLTLKIYDSIAKKLAPGAIVIGWKHVSVAGGHWESLGAVPVPASWAGKGSQDVHILRRTRLGKDEAVGSVAAGEHGEEEEAAEEEEEGDEL